MIDIEGDNVTYMDEDGETHSDLRLPNMCPADVTLTAELKQKFEEGVDGDIFITVLSAMEVDAIKSYRIAKQ